MEKGKYKEDYIRVCKICKKEYFEDTEVCSRCKTQEFIASWGDPFYDEEKISLEVVGEYLYHREYWHEYKEEKGGNCRWE